MVMMVRQDPLDLLVPWDQSEKKEVWERRDQMESQDNLERMATLEHQEHLDHEDHLDLLVPPQEELVSQDHPETLADQVALEAKEDLDLLVQMVIPEILEPLDCQDLTDQEAPLDQLESQASPVSMVTLVSMEKMESLDLREHKVLMDLEDPMGTRGPRGLWDVLVIKVHKDLAVIPEMLDRRVHEDLLVMMVLLAKTAFQESKDLRDSKERRELWERRERLETRVFLALMASRDLLVCLENQVHLVLLDQLEVKDLLDMRDQLVLAVKEELLALRDLPETKERLVTVVQLDLLVLLALLELLLLVPSQNHPQIPLAGSTVEWLMREKMLALALLIRSLNSIRR